MGDADHSDWAGGSSLPGGGPAALAVGDKGLGRQREAKAPQHQCHHWASIVTTPITPGWSNGERLRAVKGAIDAAHAGEMILMPRTANPGHGLFR